MRALGDTASDLSRAEAVNERGDVVGLGFDHYGEKRAVIWTDRPVEPVWIEPGTY